jgi:hypothetical protein
MKTSEKNNENDQPLEGHQKHYSHHTLFQGSGPEHY